MKSLLIKEWLGLRPFAILLASIWVIGVAMTLMLDFPDEYPLWESLFEDSSTTSTILLVFAFLISQGLLTREKEERTLDFLDGLPLTRCSVFAAKWSVALAVLLGFLLLLTGEALAYDMLSRNSLSGAFPWRTLALWLSLQSLFAAVALSVGLLLSYLRWLAFLALAVLFWIVWWMTQKGMPEAEWINPFHLVSAPGGKDDAWPVPWTHIQVQAALAGVFTLFALVCFVVRESSWSRRLARAATTRPARILLVLGMLAIPVAWLGLLIASSSSLQKLAEEVQEGDNQALTAEALRKLSGDNEILQQATNHYHFSFRKGQEPLLAPLLPKADGVFETVAGFLAFKPGANPSQVVVDLCHPLQEHFAGLAFWKKIRMSLEPGKPLAHRLAVLGHETTHVLISLLTAGKSEQDYTSIRWFHEGLASYVEYRFFRSAQERLQVERSLALAATWNQVDFDELIDDETLSKKRDFALAYGAGKLWCEALVDVYGDTAPARLLTGLADPAIPRQPNALSRWRRACQAASFDLERIRSRFLHRLEELRKTHAAGCQPFALPPKLTASRQGSSVSLDPALAGAKPANLPSGAHLVCRVRPDRTAPLFLYRTSRLGSDERFTFPVALFPKPSFEYQTGWFTGDWSREPVWGAWEAAVVPRG